MKLIQVKSSLTTCSLTVILAILSAPQVVASTCSTLSELRNSVSQTPADATALEAHLASLIPKAEPQQCGVTLNQSGSSTHYCYWRYAYRHSSATNNFQTLDHDVRDCTEGRATRWQDSGVNHPDTHLQVQYVSDDFTLNMSLKDKTNLKQTLLFVRVHRAP